MKLSSSLFIVVSTLAINVTATSYPFVMWSNPAFPAAQESTTATTLVDVLADFKTKSAESSQVISVVKESLDTRALLTHASQFNYLKQQVMSVYTNVE